jgi:hypothetical protein
MTYYPARAVAAVAAVGLLLAGCSSTGDPAPTSTPTPVGSTSTTATASPSVSPSPSPTSTLTAEQQQAFEEAAKVALAYRQTITDLYSGARTDLNDLNEVASGDRVDRDLKNVSLSLRKGWRSEPKGGQLVLVSAEPVKVNLKKDPPTVVVRACIDATAVTDVGPDGEREQGKRVEADYTVVKYNSARWTVTKVTAVDDVKDRAC